MQGVQSTASQFPFYVCTKQLTECGLSPACGAGAQRGLLPGDENHLLTCSAAHLPGESRYKWTHAHKRTPRHSTNKKDTNSVRVRCKRVGGTLLPSDRSFLASGLCVCGGGAPGDTGRMIVGLCLPSTSHIVEQRMAAAAAATHLGVFSSALSLTGLPLLFKAFTLLLRTSDLAAAAGSVCVMNMLHAIREFNYKFDGGSMQDSKQPAALALLRMRA